MSDFWGGLNGGSFKWPNSAINAQGPLPSGAGIQGIDGIINGSNSLLDGINAYYGPKAGPAHSDRNYQQIPHRKQYFVPVLWLPDSTGLAKVPVSHSVDQGDVVWVLKLDRPVEVFCDGNVHNSVERTKYDHLPVLVNIATVNYLLAGVQGHLATILSNTGVQHTDTYWSKFVENWVGKSNYQHLTKGSDSLLLPSIKDQKQKEEAKKSKEKQEEEKKKPDSKASKGLDAEIEEEKSAEPASKPIIEESEAHKFMKCILKKTWQGIDNNDAMNARIQGIIEWIFANRLVPWGVAAGSEKQGGQHELTLAPVTGAASHMTTLTIDGRNFDIINIWSNDYVSAGDYLTFHLKKIPSPKCYGLNHYYKSQTVQNCPFFETSLPKLKWELWHVWPSTQRSMHCESQAIDTKTQENVTWVDYLNPQNIAFEYFFNVRPETASTANRLYWKVAQSMVAKPKSVQHDASDDRMFLRSQLLEVNFAPLLVDDTKCGHLSMGGSDYVRVSMSETPATAGDEAVVHIEPCNIHGLRNDTKADKVPASMYVPMEALYWLRIACIAQLAEIIRYFLPVCKEEDEQFKKVIEYMKYKKVEANITSTSTVGGCDLKFKKNAEIPTDTRYTLSPYFYNLVFSIVLTVASSEKDTTGIAAGSTSRKAKPDAIPRIYTEKLFNDILQSVIQMADVVCKLLETVREQTKEKKDAALKVESVMAVYKYTLSKLLGDHNQYLQVNVDRLSTFPFFPEKDIRSELKDFYKASGDLPEIESKSREMAMVLNLQQPPEPFAFEGQAASSAPPDVDAAVLAAMDVALGQSVVKEKRKRKALAMQVVVDGDNTA